MRRTQLPVTRARPASYSSTLLRRELLAVAFATLLLATACTASGNSAPTVDGSGDSTAPVQATLGFETGPAVLIPAGYQPPPDRVDSTGAYLPVNDQPTLVFLEAIW